MAYLDQQKKFYKKIKDKLTLVFGHCMKLNCCQTYVLRFVYLSDNLLFPFQHFIFICLQMNLAYACFDHRKNGF